MKKTLVLLLFICFIFIHFYNDNMNQAKIAQETKMGSALQAMQNFDWNSAYGICKALSEEYPDHKPSRICLIRVLIQSADYKEANNNLVAYIEKFGKDKKIIIEQARYYAATGQYNMALSLLQPLLKQDPSNDDLLNMQQYILVRVANKTYDKYE